MPVPGSRNNGGAPSDNSGARHSKLRNGSSGSGGGLQQINLASGKANKKNSQTRGDANTLPSTGMEGHHQKQVKPSELSLDLIIPSSIRGAKQSPMSGAHQAKNSSSHHNSSVNAPMLVNLRTPQNNNGMLQPIAHGKQMKPKELQNLLTNHD